MVHLIIFLREKNFRSLASVLSWKKTLGSIVDLTRLPSALFVVDVMKEHIAVREANRFGYSCIRYG